MKLAEDMWSGFSTYLFIDRKLSDKGNEKSTKRSRFRLLIRYFNTIEFNRANFLQFIQDQKEKGRSNAYINNLITFCKHLDRYLKLEEIQDFSYFKEEKKQYTILTPTEIKKLAELYIEYARQPELTNHRYRTIIYFLGLTGCRISELLDLKWTDVSYDPFCVRFRDTKNDTDRVIPLPEFLYRLIEQMPRKSNYVFTAFKGGRLDKLTIAYDIKNRASLLGINKRIWLHLFRHSYITTMLESGVDISDVAILVGHQNIQSTMSYKNSMIGHYTNIIHMHPFLKESMSFEMLSKKVKEYLERFIDTKRFELNINSTNNKLDICIKEE